MIGALRTRRHAIVLALVVCAVSAVAEGVLAGSEVAARFHELRMPRWSPPLWLWGVIGAGYYAICFTIIYRLVSRPVVRGTKMAFALLLLLMSVNAAWNFVFFRGKSPFAIFVFFLPYAFVALLLLITLLRVEKTSALVLLPYVLYLAYATAWGYAVWRANDAREAVLTDIAPGTIAARPARDG